LLKISTAGITNLKRVHELRRNTATRYCLYRRWTLLPKEIKNAMKAVEKVTVPVRNLLQRLISRCNEHDDKGMTIEGRNDGQYGVQGNA